MAFDVHAFEPWGCEVSYSRVLPRDAFNEANLLKCIGMLTLAIEDGVAPGWSYSYDDEPFNVEQSPDDGSISLVNVEFKLDGYPVKLSRPLNAREPFPLWVEFGDDCDSLQVFNGDGKLVVKGGR